MRYVLVLIGPDAIRDIEDRFATAPSRHLTSAPTDFASIGGNESGESFEQRGFARDVRSDYAKYFAKLKAKYPSAPPDIFPQ